MGKPGKLVLAALVAFLAACQPAAEDAAPDPLETEEIGAAVDAAVTTEYDIQAKSSEEIVGARMPSDFPRDVPLPGSSTLINYGPAAEGRRFVEFSIPAQPGRVEPRYNGELEAAGWQSDGGGEFARQGRRLVVTYRQGTPGTWVRIEYPA